MVIKNNCVGSVYLADLNVVLPKAFILDLGQFFSKQEIKHSRSLRTCLDRKFVLRLGASTPNPPLQVLPDELRLKRPTLEIPHNIKPEEGSLLSMEQRLQRKENPELKKKVVRHIERSFEEL